MTGAPVTVTAIIQSVAAAFEIPAREIAKYRNARTDDHTPLHVACYLARRLTTLSMRQIGEHFAGRGSDLVARGVRFCMDRMEADASFAADVATIEQTILALARRQLLPRREPVNPLDLARRIIANPVRLAPQVSIDTVIELSGMLVDLAEIATGARELLDIRLGRMDAPPDELAEIDAALTASLLSMLDTVGVRSRHPAPEEEINNAA